MKYIFIINPQSGTVRNKNFLKNIIRQDIPGEAKITYTEYPGHASKLATDAINSGFKYVIAVGGDGTLNEVGSVLIGRKAVLGLIPMGSGNGFARSLNIPLNPQKAFKTILIGKTRFVDAGSVNNRFFFTVAGVGFEAYVAERFQKSNFRGPVPYFYKGLQSFFKYGYPGFTIEIAGEKKSICPLTIAIANAPQYGNGAIISPEADMSDGLLNICIIDKINFSRLIKHVNLLFKNKINRLPAYNSFKSKEIKIFSDGKIKFHTDGEPGIADQALTFKIIPKAINIII
jgi:YegS/Rv2252/BmrU family lipid kinase